MSKVMIRAEGTEMFKDTASLVEYHHFEVESQRKALDVDYDMYKALEDAGMYHGFTAREDGRLVGYASFLTTPDLHHIGQTMAMCDTLFVLPSKRGQWTGIRILKFAEGVLKDRGADLMFVQTKIQHDFKSILTRIGYEPTEIQYTKKLGE